MTNGGSDCCGTSWFDRSNRGQSGHIPADPTIAPHCEARDFAIQVAFYTSCANHPLRRDQLQMTRDAMSKIRARKPPLA